ncbi:hypothetical protein [Brucella endophytica]|uniref:hypothetical protein n=1 Tax=Brucella endophytica TaxID=1963359 RepID=UPI00166CFC6A|nr:hypothetical protein [Brucella endophytica]
MKIETVLDPVEAGFDMGHAGSDAVHIALHRMKLVTDRHIIVPQLADCVIKLVKALMHPAQKFMQKVL